MSSCAPDGVAARPSLALPGSHRLAAVGKPSAARLFDAAAMALYPWLARAFGYRFRVGLDEALVADGRSVHRAVWAEIGVDPGALDATLSQRYARAASCWIVAYHGDAPVGAMALCDLRVASVTLDFEGCLPPRGIDLARTREIAKLAILKAHRGHGQLVMVGLLREMLVWSKRAGIVQLFGGSEQRHYRMYRRFNPTARLHDKRPGPPQPESLVRYYQPLRRWSGPSVLFSFEVQGASPWRVFSDLVARKLGRRRA